jgi:Uma2 family endonuclease
VCVADGRRRADRVIWASLGRRPDLEHDVPTIVAEFVSTSRHDRYRDYEERRLQYLDLGVKEY